MKVLVTGGDGFIGSHVMQELKRQGHEPRSFDIASTKCDDVRQPDRLTVLGDYDAVIHLAGLLGTSELFDQFEDAVATNLVGTKNVLDYCYDREARFVGITIPKVWANVYQATKAAAKVLETAYHESFGVPVANVMAFNAYGPGQKHGPGHPQKILPTFATLAYANEDIPIWGDGEQTVDLVSAGDVANVLVDAIAFGDDFTFDAGTGLEWSVNDVAHLVCNITESKSKIVHLPMRDGERPGTKLAATGEGWDRLERHPEFDMIDFADAVASYKP